MCSFPRLGSGLSVAWMVWPSRVTVTPGTGGTVSALTLARTTSTVLSR